MDFSELLNEYLDESRGHIELFDTALLSLEKEGYNKEIIQNALRALHTLKGNSGMMGYESLKTYVHKVEEILKKVLEKERDFSEVMDTLFESANVMRKALEEIEKRPEGDVDITNEILKIEGVSKGIQPEREKKTIELSSYLGTKTDTIKVDFKRLDELLNLVGELVIYKTRLNQIETEIRGSIGNKYLAKDLKDTLDIMGKTISALQEGIMRVRMLPIKHVFSKFPRMVRDLARQQGKEVELIFEGEETELDKTVIDELGEPLLHMIRNAIDHGIESPEERVKKGKPPAGKLTLSALQESNYIVIKVMDDGRGIDIEEVKRKGIEKGLINSDAPSDKETLLSLIFSPGFSTREEATEISGRGVGLDVVSRNITRLNGHIIVDSSPGKGTTFTIKLPLSLAIIPALMAEVGDEIYAIPMSAVDETIKVQEEDFHYINNREVIKFREKVLPVIRLDKFFGIKAKKQKMFYLVILSKAEKHLAVTVDRLRGQQEIVIKPLDDSIGKIYGIVGASILGDGRIVLIIDISTFFEKRGY
jgi:two-component system chemotaxis sensor kinase CheA